MVSRSAGCRRLPEDSCRSMRSTTTPRPHRVINDQTNDVLATDRQTMAKIQHPARGATRRPLFTSDRCYGDPSQQAHEKTRTKRNKVHVQRWRSRAKYCKGAKGRWALLPSSDPARTPSPRQQPCSISMTRILSRQPA